MRELRGVARIVQGVFSVLAWAAVTLWLGSRLLWRLPRLVGRWKLLNRDRLLCPRGHEVVLLGTWRCGCGAAFDGFAFARCQVCGRTAGWIPCPRCQLVIRNPALD